jgi:hypothetical protein
MAYRLLLFNALQRRPRNSILPVALFVAAAAILGSQANSVAAPPAANPFAGTWTYRSFRNTPDPVGDVSKDPSKLVAMLFAEAEWVVQDTQANAFKGELRFSPTDVMDLTGTITPATASSPARVHINGKGRPGTSTAQLFYDYDGALAMKWPNGINQRPAIVGSVIRVKAHDGSPAGYVASFIAVKRD